MKNYYKVRLDCFSCGYSWMVDIRIFNQCQCNQICNCRSNPIVGISGFDACAFMENGKVCYKNREQTEARYLDLSDPQYLRFVNEKQYYTEVLRKPELLTFL